VGDTTKISRGMKAKLTLQIIGPDPRRIESCREYNVHLGVLQYDVLRAPGASSAAWETPRWELGDPYCGLPSRVGLGILPKARGQPAS
jgi:hypothetical protein